jgi:hypothetical protein
MWGKAKSEELMKTTIQMGKRPLETHRRSQPRKKNSSAVVWIGKRVRATIR